jgi:hypothetical protein
LCLLQTALGFTIQLPTGMSSHILSDVSALGSGSSRIADVLLTDSYTAYTETQRANTVAFLQQGAGMVTGGQAWWVVAAWLLFLLSLLSAVCLAHHVTVCCV